MRQDKRSANTSTLLIEMPKELSYALSHRVIEMRQAGQPMTKAGLMIRFASEKLRDEGDSQSINK